jgi:hypothetical protein
MIYSIIKPYYQPDSFLVSSFWMRRRTDHLWAAICGYALILLLALACRPDLKPGFATGMSAPSAPRTSIESSPAGTMLQSHFDWCAPAVRRTHCPLPVLVSGALDGARQDSHSAPYYGPLYRRPPPSLS